MPRIERFFANQKVPDWTGGTLGGAAAAFSVDPTSGTSNTYSGYESRKFTSGGTFTVDSGTSEVDIIIVGGGGGGSGTLGKSPRGILGTGGGGGGVFVLTNVTVSATGGPGGDGAYPITVGSGGPGGPGVVHPGTDENANGSLGGNSGFDKILVSGGGGGKIGYEGFGDPQPSGVTLRNKVHGGSGGGSAEKSPQQSWSQIGGWGIPGQGYPGGLATGQNGGGGGGKGATGGNGWSGLGPSPSRPPHPFSPFSEPTSINFNYGGFAGATTPNDYETGSALHYGGGGGTSTGWAGSSLGPAPSPTRWLMTPPYGVGQPVQGRSGATTAPPSYPTTNNPFGDMAPYPIDGEAATANFGCGGGGGGAAQWSPYPSSLPELGDGGAGGSGVVIVRWAV